MRFEENINSKFKINSKTKKYIYESPIIKLFE